MGDEDSYSAWKDRCDRYFTSISESESVRNGGYEKNRHMKKWRTLRDVTSDELTKSDATSNFDRAKLWFSAVDIHGLGIAGTTTNVLETSIWIIITCVAFSGFVFLVYLNFSVYYLQSSSFRTEQVGAGISEAPFVTVCNMNKLRFSVVASTGDRFRDLLIPMTTTSMSSPSLTKNGTDAIKSTTFQTFLRNVLDKEKYDKLMSEIDSSFEPYSSMTSQNDWYSVYRASLRYGFRILEQAVRPIREEQWKFGHHANKTLVQCLYNGKSCLQDVLEIVDEDFGRCFTIPPSVTRTMGEIELRLNIEPDEYIDVLSPEHGAVIFIHTQESNLRDGQRHTLAPGSSYIIDLQKIVKSKKLQDCINRQGYNRKKCMSDCIDSFSQAYCKCRQNFESDNAERCRINVQFEFVCSAALSYLASNGELPCSCPLPCSTSTIETTKNSLPWPSAGNLKHEQKYLQNQGIVMTDSRFRSSMIKVSLDFTNAKETSLTEENASTLLQLLANIGGVSSLLIGMSIISVLEVLWLTIRACLVSCVESYQRKQRQDKNIEKLSDSDFTSVTWAAQKERLRYEAQHKEEIIGRKGLWSQEPIRRNSGRCQALRPIPEESKSTNTFSVKHSSTKTGGQPHHGMFTKYAPYNRYPSQPTIVNTIKPEDQAKGNEFPLFHSLDQSSGPRCSTPENKDSRGPHLLHMDSDARHYPERGRIISPTDAIQMYGPSARKYYVSEPYNI